MSTKVFFNLEEVVRNWALSHFDGNATARQKKLREKEKKEPKRHLHLEIDWSETTFVDETLWSPLTDDQDEQKLQNGTAQSQQNNCITAGGQATSNNTVRRPDVSMPQSSQCRSNVLFHTTFTNNTDGAQEYTMKTEKTTRSSLTTSIEHGLTKGVEMGIKLSAPGEVFEANAGFKRETTLTKAEGETFEEELTWGVESQIHVDGHHVAEASLVVEERRQAGDFEVVTRIKGPVFFTFTAPSDNNSFVKSVGNSIADIVEKYLEIERKKGATKVFEFVKIEEDTGTVVVRTKGTCHFRYGIRQQIRVDQRTVND
jgi:hypothetical protein